MPENRSGTAPVFQPGQRDASPHHPVLPLHSQLFLPNAAHPPPKTKSRIYLPPLQKTAEMDQGEFATASADSNSFLHLTAYLRQPIISIVPRHEQSSFILTIVAITKLIEAAMLLAVGFGVHHLMQGNMQAIVLHWTHAVRVDPDNRFAHTLVSKMTGLSPGRLEEIGVGTLLYGTLFAVEGTGLLLKKRWAEYVTIISTAGFLPVEIYEVIQHARLARIVVLVLNAAIVVYLILRLKNTARQDTIAESVPSNLAA